MREITDYKELKPLITYSIRINDYYTENNTKIIIVGKEVYVISDKLFPTTSDIPIIRLFKKDNEGDVCWILLSEFIEAFNHHLYRVYFIENNNPFKQLEFL